MLERSKKQLKKQRRTIILVFKILLLFNFSCRETTREKNIFKNDVVEFYFDFPDTIKVNKFYNGKINYKGILDTVTKSFYDKKKNRYIYFFMNKTDKLEQNIQLIKQKKLDTFGAINNNIIPFYNIKFNKKGTYYIDGYIEDHVLIEKMPNEKKSRYIENIVKATHKVIVVE